MKTPAVSQEKIPFMTTFEPVTYFFRFEANYYTTGVLEG